MSLSIYNTSVFEADYIKRYQFRFKIFSKIFSTNYKNIHFWEFAIITIKNKL